MEETNKAMWGERLFQIRRGLLIMGLVKGVKEKGRYSGFKRFTSDAENSCFGGGRGPIS
jgi:hypothetical protein